MKIEINKVNEAALESIKAAAISKEPIEITGSSLTREDEEKVNNVLLAVLDATNQSHLFSYLSYSALELLANANKANAKRVYFSEKKLDINNPDDYKNGMLTFSTEITVNKQHFQKLAEEQNMFINMLITIDDNINVQVSNTAQLTAIELERINDKLERAKIYNSMDEALTDIDKTEGSGLGLIIIVLMLKQLGQSRDNLSFESSNGITKFSISVPLDAIEGI